MKRRDPETRTPELRPERHEQANAVDGVTGMAETAPIADWNEIARGAFYRPIKHPLSLRLDADIIAWFQQQGQGYQTRINSALREYIATHSKGSEVPR
jgi:uncharacterized protein (DUF4415 family)